MMSCSNLESIKAKMEPCTPDLTPLMKDHERDVLRSTILELVKKGHVHYTDIEKKAVATCLRFATSNTVRKQFYDYLLPNGFVERVSRGEYKITEKGEKLLGILDWAPFSLFIFGIRIRLGQKKKE